jgi:hypothetical protein
MTEKEAGHHGQTVGTFHALADQVSPEWQRFVHDEGFFLKGFGYVLERCPLNLKSMLEEAVVRCRPAGRTGLLRGQTSVAHERNAASSLN